MKLTPQQEQIVELHRDKAWHCSTEIEYIRDHRKRISELNEGYLAQKGWQLVGKPCDGSPKDCKGGHRSNLYMRRAERINVPTGQITRNTGTSEVDSLIVSGNQFFEGIISK